jgi:hypothetical protein
LGGQYRSRNYPRAKLRIPENGFHCFDDITGLSYTGQWPLVQGARSAVFISVRQFDRAGWRQTKSGKQKRGSNEGRVKLSED